MVIMSAPASAIGPAATRGSIRNSRSKMGNIIPRTAEPVTPPVMPPTRARASRGSPSQARAANATAAPALAPASLPSLSLDTAATALTAKWAADPCSELRRQADRLTAHAFQLRFSTSGMKKASSTTRFSTSLNTPDRKAASKPGRKIADQPGPSLEKRPPRRARVGVGRVDANLLEEIVTGRGVVEAMDFLYVLFHIHNAEHKAGLVHHRKRQHPPPQEMLAGLAQGCRRRQRFHGRGHDFPPAALFHWTHQ